MNCRQTDVIRWQTKKILNNLKSRKVIEDKRISEQSVNRLSCEHKCQTWRIGEREGEKCKKNVHIHKKCGAQKGQQFSLFWSKDTEWGVPSAADVNSGEEEEEGTNGGDDKRADTLTWELQSTLLSALYIQISIVRDGFTVPVALLSAFARLLRLTRVVESKVAVVKRSEHLAIYMPIHFTLHQVSHQMSSGLALVAVAAGEGGGGTMQIKVCRLKLTTHRNGK